jgi:hypothetical protein
MSGMTPDERDRLAKAEQAIVDIRADTLATRNDVAELKAALNMGRGAWFAAVKIGAVLLMAVGALAWLWDRIKAPHP